MGSWQQTVFSFGGAFRSIGHAGKAPHVEPGAKRLAFAAEHHATQTGRGFKLADGLLQRCEHGHVQRVHLVGADQGDFGDAVFVELDADAVVHGVVLPVGQWFRSGRF